MPLESLSSFVKAYAAHGNEIAVRQRRGYRMETWTYGRIAEQANRLARELELRGIAKGDAVLLWGENSAEWIIAFLGCLLCGVVVVPIDHASPMDFACRVAREVNAKLIFRAATQKLERDGNAEPYSVLLMNGPAPDPAAAVERANQSLADYQKIRHWVLWPEPDFPRTPTQKPILPLIREVIKNAGSTAPAGSSDGDSLTGLIARITGHPVRRNAKNINLEADLQLTSLDRVELMSCS